MNKPSIPQTSFKSDNSKTLKFNLSMMIRNYYIAKYLLAKFQQIDLKDSVSWYAGLICAYDGWFEALGVVQEIFDSILEKLNRDEMNKNAELMFDNIMKMLRPAIILPGQIPVEADVLKKNFMKKLEE